MRSFVSGKFTNVSVKCTCFQDLSDQETVEPWNKTQAGICRCLQALTEALKTNVSVTDIDLGWNEIGAEGAEAWCVVGSAECCDMS